MDTFSKNLNELSTTFATRKDCIKRYLTTHFKENTDYIVMKQKSSNGRRQENILLTEKVYDLINTSYNLKNRYITKIHNVHMINPVLMSLENSTIGFIQNTLDGIVNVQRQYKIGSYFIDAYIPEIKIAIECDELAHKDYKSENEVARETYIKQTLGCKFVRFNPSEKEFDFSTILNILFKEIALGIRKNNEYSYDA
jgi:very-short-patch-repair endonuclease